MIINDDFVQSFQTTVHEQVICAVLAFLVIVALQLGNYLGRKR